MSNNTHTGRQLLINEWVALIPGKNLKLTESTGADGVKFLVAEGLFGWCDKPTANGRIYPKAIMEREINRLQGVIKSNRLAGELEHPEDGTTNLNRVSHRITELKVNPDGSVTGKLEAMGTTKGEELRKIFESGLIVGVSSRGLGSVVEDRSTGNKIVQEDFSLLTYDVVADPAVGNALPEFRYESGPYGTMAMVPEETQKYQIAVEGNKRKEESTMSMTLEKLKEQYPELVNAIQESTAESFEAKLQAQEAKFAATLEKAIAGIPSLNAMGDSRMSEAVDQIKAAVRPLISESQVNESYEKQINGLKSRLSESEKLVNDLRLHIAEADNQIKKANIGRELAMVMPCIVEGHRSKFLKLLGPQEHFDGIESFRERVATLAEDFKERGLYVENVDQALLALRNADRKVEMLESKLAKRDGVLNRSVSSMQKLRDDNKRLAESVVARDNLLKKAKSQIVTLSEQVERRNSILESAKKEIQGLLTQERKSDALMESASKEIKTLRREVKSLKSEAVSLQESKKSLELDLYRHKRVIGHKAPNQVLKHLREAKSKSEVDSLYESIGGGVSHSTSTSLLESSRPKASPSPVSEGLDILLDENIKSKIFQMANTPTPQEELNLLRESANTRIASKFFESEGSEDDDDQDLMDEGSDSDEFEESYDADSEYHDEGNSMMMLDDGDEDEGFTSIKAVESRPAIIPGFEPSKAMRLLEGLNSSQVEDFSRRK
jgi:hypothetical protein